MKYVITGSIGHISKPIVQQLISAGHAVTVISSSPDKKAAIEQLGATAAIGSVQDKDFLKQAFAGADAVYLMIPPNFAATDLNAYQEEVADNYVYAVKENKIPYVVQLSSIGAHLRKGAGPIDGLAYLEEQLGALKGTQVKFLRPAYFYYNFFAMTGLIKQAGIMGGNFGGTDEKMLLVHTSDIANEAARQLLALDFTGHSVSYIVSDEKHSGEIAAVLGQAIQKPGIPWVMFKDDEALQGMLQSGLSNTMAEGYLQMGKAFREGLVQEEYFAHNMAPAGKVKLEDFAKEFSAVYALS